MTKNRPISNDPRGYEARCAHKRTESGSGIFEFLARCEHIKRSQIY